MNPFGILESFQQDCFAHIRTFQRFQNPQAGD